MAIPQHPDEDDQSVSTKKPVSTQTKVIVAVVVVLLVAMIVLSRRWSVRAMRSPMHCRS